ncbi:hypothetical protein [Vibrio nigripulchritudo]|uniref:hypothetical protein n=2 Tax=Vibrio nigripulchritudo TaxID=28173 RepID=UPI00056F8F61|nr:hypothetical protein [Vibrio nigripulchritudo]
MKRTEDTDVRSQLIEAVSRLYGAHMFLSDLAENETEKSAIVQKRMHDASARIGKLGGCVEYVTDGASQRPEARDLHGGLIPYACGRAEFTTLSEHFKRELSLA